MYGLGSNLSAFSGGMSGLPSSMSGALGIAPTGIYSGLDPSASAGTYGGNPLGGGAAGQASAAPAAGNSMSPLAQMMLMQQASQAASQLGQQGLVSTQGQQQYANPQTPVTPSQTTPTVNPAMLGMIMSGSR